MAARRSVLVGLGGFDPRLLPALAASDLNLRLAARGLCTVLVPIAEVHQDNWNGGDPFETGASWAVLLGKHCPQNRQFAAWQWVRRPSANAPCRQ